MLKGNDGTVPIGVPRARDGSFEPELIKKGQTRIDGMDDKIIGLHAADLSARKIRAHLEEVYRLKVSADLVSRVTDAVLEEVSDWQNRALDQFGRSPWCSSFASMAFQKITACWRRGPYHWLLHCKTNLVRIAIVRSSHVCTDLNAGPDPTFGAPSQFAPPFNLDIG